MTMSQQDPGNIHVKALMLLNRFLDETQQRTYHQGGWFVCTGSDGGRFVLSKQFPPGTVDIAQHTQRDGWSEAAQGTYMRTFCVYPAYVDEYHRYFSDFPDGDKLLAFKLFIENREQEFREFPFSGYYVQDQLARYLPGFNIADYAK